MKYKINKEAFDALGEELQKLYAEKDGDYVLQVEGLPEPDKGGDDNSGLINKNKELLDELKKIKAKAREEEAAKSKAEEEAAKKAGDIEALEKSWNEKLDKSVAEKQAVIDALQGSLDELLVDNVAQQMANEIGTKGNESILIPHIKQRLAVEERDGSHITTVRDLQGKPSALTLEDLKTEFIGNAAFAPVIVGSRANGGGAAGGQVGGGATDKKPTDYTEKERVALFKENPEKFNELFNK